MKIVELRIDNYYQIIGRFRVGAEGAPQNVFERYRYFLNLLHVLKSEVFIRGRG